MAIIGAAHSKPFSSEKKRKPENVKHGEILMMREILFTLLLYGFVVCICIMYDLEEQNTFTEFWIATFNFFLNFLILVALYKKGWCFLKAAYIISIVTIGVLCSFLLNAVAYYFSLYIIDGTPNEEVGYLIIFYGLVIIIESLVTLEIRNALHGMMLGEEICSATSLMNHYDKLPIYTEAR